MMKKATLVILLAYLCLAVAASAGVPGIPYSDFNDGTLQGWTKLQPFGGKLFNPGLGGNPGGFMQCQDTVAGPPGIVAVAPSDFTGNLSNYAKIGGGLAWDEYLYSCGSNQAATWPQLIGGADNTVYRELNPPVGSTGAWHHRFVPFTSSAWEWVSGTATFQQVIANVTSLRFNMDTNKNESCADEAGIDNVRFSRNTSAAVMLSSFTATGVRGYTELGWTTASEIGNAGFNVYRSSSENDLGTRMNEELIATKGGSGSGASYSFADNDVAEGRTYFYSLESVDLKGESFVETAAAVEVGKRAGSSPAGFRLTQNYPNPFNPSTEIMYELPVACGVRLDIYDASGRRVATLVDEYQTAGSKIVRWDGKGLNASLASSGIYFYRLRAGNFEETKKLIMVR